MNLLAPEVVGPLSTCSTQVRIRGYIAGALVKVLVNGEETNSKVSPWLDDMFDIRRPLGPGHRVTAKQEYDGVESDESPLPILVQDVPSSVSEPTVRTHLRECGRGVWIQGTVPGAKVTASINNTEVGSATSIDGNARIVYEPGLQAGQSLQLEQALCNNMSYHTTSPEAEPLPDPLLEPRIEGPLIECMTTITVSNVVDGATVTIYRREEETTHIFDRSSQIVGLLNPLRLHEVIEVEQSFNCGREDEEPTHESRRARAEVLSADDLPKPVIVGPICPNTPTITISNLLPGARVVVHVDGTMWETDTPKSTFTFAAPPVIHPLAQVTAQVRLCGREGPRSDPAEIKGDMLWHPVVATPNACASHVAIRSFVSSGGGAKTVHVRNAQGHQISSHHQIVPSTQTRIIPVSPALVAGDEITLVARLCDGSETTFGPHAVVPSDDLPPPKLERLYLGEKVVAVESAFAGAVIRIYIDGQFAAQGISWGALGDTLIWYPEGLRRGQKVTATQVLCGNRVSAQSNPVVVTNPPPLAPLLIMPEKDPPRTPAKPVQFKWYDPGANTPMAAEIFRLGVEDTSATVVHSNSTAGENDAADLEYDARYEWFVLAVNEGGYAKSPPRSFLTEPEPAPQREPDAKLRFFGSLLAGEPPDSFLPQLDAGTPFKFFTSVVNVGNATSEKFKVEFEWYGTNNNETGSGTDSPPSPLQPQGQIWVSAEVPNGLPTGDYVCKAKLVVDQSLRDEAYLPHMEVR